MGNVATVVYIWTREVKAIWLYGCGEAELCKAEGVGFVMRLIVDYS